MRNLKLKPLTKMNARDLADATREFDEPFVMDRGRPRIGIGSGIAHRPQGGLTLQPIGRKGGQGGKGN